MLDKWNLSWYTCTVNQILMIGVYFLFRKKELVYIGKTIHWPGRMADHKTKKFNRVRFIECDPLRLSEYETRLINYFTPIDNKYVHPVKSFITSAYERQKKSINELMDLIYEFKKERLIQGMTSGDITGNNGKGVYRMESGKVSPRIDTFVRWCDKLGLEMILVKDNGEI